MKRNITINSSKFYNKDTDYTDYTEYTNYTEYTD